MESRAHAVIAGLFVIVLLIAGVVGLWWFGDRKEATREIVIVTQGNVGGLNLQAAVRYRGIRVGKVIDIELDSADVRNILITAEVADSVPLTRATTASLNYQGVTGLAHVLLEDPGTDPSPLTGDGDMPPRIVMHPSLLQEIGSAGTTLVKESLTFLQRANRMLDAENQRNLAQTLAKLNEASGELASAAQRVGPVLARIETAASDANLQRVERGLDRFAAAAGSADTTLRSWQTVADDVQRVAKSADTLIADANRDGALGELVPRLNRLAGDLEQTNRQLGRVLDQFEQAPQSILSGPPLQPAAPGEPGFVVPQGAAR